MSIANIIFFRYSMSIETVMRELTTLHLAEKSAISLEKTEPEYILHIDSQLRYEYVCCLFEGVCGTLPLGGGRLDCKIGGRWCIGLTGGRLAMQTGGRWDFETGPCHSPLFFVLTIAIGII